MRAIELAHSLVFSHWVSLLRKPDQNAFLDGLARNCRTSLLGITKFLRVRGLDHERRLTYDTVQYDIWALNIMVIYSFVCTNSHFDRQRLTIPERVLSHANLLCDWYLPLGAVVHLQY